MDRETPVCTFLAHQVRAYEEPGPFIQAVKKEISEEWFSIGTDFPRTVPCRAYPGNIEPEKKTDACQLIWNNRTSLRETWDRDTEDVARVRILVATNGSTKLSTEILFEWASIDSKNEFVAILIKGGKIFGFRKLGEFSI